MQIEPRKMTNSQYLSLSSQMLNLDNEHVINFSGFQLQTVMVQKNGGQMLASFRAALTA